VSTPLPSIDKQHDVVVVGGGFAGSMVGVQLLRCGRPGISVGIIERRRLLGRGRAYDTSCHQHLLNVPAIEMGAFPECPEQFWNWTKEHINSTIGPHEFLPRAVYGRYVEFVLRQAIHGRPDACWSRLRDEVIDGEEIEGGAQLRLRSGITIRGRVIVLAVGGSLSSNFPAVMEDPIRGLPDPWDSRFLSASRGARSILLLGSGLTAVDAAIALDADGFRGPIVMLSRHGLLPMTHTSEAVSGNHKDDTMPANIRMMVREIRRRIKAESEGDCSWQSVIDSLRNGTQTRWSVLPEEERSRFLRHLRSYWEVHRHRMPSSTHLTITRMLNDGALRLIKGRVCSIRKVTQGEEIILRRRGSVTPESLLVSVVVNCAGHTASLARIEDNFVRSLVDRGTATVGKLKLGLVVSSEGALISNQGCASNVFYTIGSLRKEALWETTAVREIREQARSLAELISHRLP
jgi:uncharacterized NAD(P)/FAD-binding protein YdhS